MKKKAADELAKWKAEHAKGITDRLVRNKDDEENFIQQVLSTERLYCLASVLPCSIPPTANDLSGFESIVTWIVYLTWPGLGLILADIAARQRCPWQRVGACGVPRRL